MAYDEELAGRIRAIQGDDPEITERKMFGGLAFLILGNMAYGIIGEDLMVRVGRDRQAACLVLDHVREMDFTGRPMSSMVYVAPTGLLEDVSLGAWMERGAEYAASFPPK